MSIPYYAIDSFFDHYGLKYARTTLSSIIKAANTEKTWKGKCPANLLLFMEKLEDLATDVFTIIENYEYRQEVVLEKPGTESLWMLTKYGTYCNYHMHSTPWDFFPRHLSKKEFLDPYKALKKFTRYKSLTHWKRIMKETLSHALSPHSIAEYDNGAGILQTWLYLHKLLEATHLVVTRSEEVKPQSRVRWRGAENVLVEEREVQA